MTELQSWRLASFMNQEMSFASLRVPELQIADLLAYEAMKHLDNRIGPVKRPIRKSAQALLKTGRFRFEEYCLDELLSILQRSAELDLPGNKMSEYLAWLKRRKCDDSQSNRSVYLKALTDSRDKGITIKP